MKKTILFILFILVSCEYRNISIYSASSQVNVFFKKNTNIHKDEIEYYFLKNKATNKIENLIIQEDSQLTLDEGYYFIAHFILKPVNKTNYQINYLKVYDNYALKESSCVNNKFIVAQPLPYAKKIEYLTVITVPTKETNKAFSINKCTALGIYGTEENPIEVIKNNESYTAYFLTEHLQQPPQISINTTMKQVVDKTFLSSKGINLNTMQFSHIPVVFE